MQELKQRSGTAKTTILVSIKIVNILSQLITATNRTAIPEATLNRILKLFVHREHRKRAMNLRNFHELIYAGRLFALFLLLLILNSTATANEMALRIDNQLFSTNLLKYLGDTVLPSTKFCPPTSDEHARDEFVRLVLLATYSEKIEQSEYRDRLQIALKPSLELVDKLESLVKSHKDHRLIQSVYERQLARIKNTIVAFKLSATKEYESHTKARLNSTSVVATNKQLSEKEKTYIAKLKKFNALYKRKLKNAISDDDTYNRYQKLVLANDPKLVNVQLVNTRMALLRSDEKALVDKVSALLRNNAPGQQVSTVAGMASIHTMHDSPRWSRQYHSLPAGKPPAELLTGDVDVRHAYDRKFGDDTLSLYLLTYYYDVKHYPVIEYEQTTEIRYFSAKKYAHEKEFEHRLSQLYGRLWVESNVTLNNKPLQPQKVYASCQKK